LSLIPWFNAGKAQLLAGRPADAEASFRGVLGRLRTREGIDGRLALGAWFGLGRSLAAQRRFGEALGALDSAAALTAGLPGSSALPSEVMVDRASVLIGLGRPVEAEALAREAVAWRRANLSPRDKALADAIFTLSRAIMAGAGTPARRQEGTGLANEALGLLRGIPWPLAQRAEIESTLVQWQRQR
jgi:tetratricopeptide (TPR) repeat protein